MVSHGIDSMDNQVTENENIHLDTSENGLQDAIDDVLQGSDEFACFKDLNNEFVHPQSTPPEPQQAPPELPQRSEESIDSSLSQLIDIPDHYNRMPPPLSYAGFYLLNELVSYIQNHAQKH